MIKSGLRRIYLEKRAALSPDELATLTGDIARRLFDGVELGAVRILHCFIPIQKFHEIDTWPIINRIWVDFPSITTVAPRTDLEKGDIESIRFSADTRLVETRWGIREPAGGEIVEPDSIDLVLVPLLCFDRNGHRVGYGKGFYDRLLSNCRSDCLKISLSFFSQVEEISDINENDVKLDMVVMPGAIRRFSIPDQKMQNAGDF